MKKKLYIVHTVWADHHTAMGQGKIHYAGHDKNDAERIQKDLDKKFNMAKDQHGNEYCGATITKLKANKGWK